MFILIGFGILFGALTVHQKDYDACKKVEFKGEVCKWAKATCNVNKENKCGE